MSSLPTKNQLSMNLLTKKLCPLLCLLSQQYSQTISCLKVDRSILAHGTYTSYINTIQETTRPGETSTPFGHFSHLNPL